MNKAEQAFRLGCAAGAAAAFGSLGASVFGPVGTFLGAAGAVAGWLNGAAPLRWAVTAVTAGAAAWGGGVVGWTAGVTAGAGVSAAFGREGGSWVAAGGVSAFCAVTYAVGGVGLAAGRGGDLTKAAFGAGTVVAMGWISDFLARRLSEREVRASEERRAVEVVAQEAAEGEVSSPESEEQEELEGADVERGGGTGLGNRKAEMDDIYRRGVEKVRATQRARVEEVETAETVARVATPVEGGVAAAETETKEEVVKMNNASREASDTAVTPRRITDDGRLARVASLFRAVSEEPTPSDFEEAFAGLLEGAAVIARSPVDNNAFVESVRLEAVAIDDGGAIEESKVKLRALVGVTGVRIAVAAPRLLAAGGAITERPSELSSEPERAKASRGVTDWGDLVARMKDFAAAGDLADGDVDRATEKTSFEASDRTTLNAALGTLKWLENLELSPASFADVRERVKGLLRGREISGCDDVLAAAIRTLVGQACRTEPDGVKRFGRAAARFATLLERVEVEAGRAEMERLVKIEKPQRSELAIGELADWLSGRCGWQLEAFGRWRERSAMSRAAVLAEPRDSEKESREIGELLMKRRWAETLVNDGPDAMDRRRRFEVIGVCGRAGQLLVGLASRMLKEEEKERGDEWRLLGFRLKKRAFAEVEDLRALGLPGGTVIKTAAGFALSSASELAYLGDFGDRANGDRLPEEILQVDLQTACDEVDRLGAELEAAREETRTASESARASGDFFGWAGQVIIDRIESSSLVGQDRQKFGLVAEVTRGSDVVAFIAVLLPGLLNASLRSDGGRRIASETEGYDVNLDVIAAAIVGARLFKDGTLVRLKFVVFGATGFSVSGTDALDIVSSERLSDEPTLQQLMSEERGLLDFVAGEKPGDGESGARKRVRAERGPLTRESVHT